jgi:hypothetical protein
VDEGVRWGSKGYGVGVAWVIDAIYVLERLWGEWITDLVLHWHLR